MARSIESPLQHAYTCSAHLHVIHFPGSRNEREAGARLRAREGSTRQRGDQSKASQDDCCDCQCQPRQHSACDEVSQG
eukprot:13207032-Alexandrium_andersonii.AAC.1